MLEYRLGGEKLGEVPVVTAGSVREARFGDYVRKLAGALFMEEKEEEGQAGEAGVRDGEGEAVESSSDGESEKGGGEELE